jgi:hypothetical protein
MPKGRCKFPEKDQLTQREAQARRDAFRRDPRNGYVQAYRCPAGGHYHVGHPRGRKRKKW